MSDILVHMVVVSISSAYRRKPENRWTPESAGVAHVKSTLCTQEPATMDGCYSMDTLILELSHYKSVYRVQMPDCNVYTPLCTESPSNKHILVLNHLQHTWLHN